VEAKITPSHLEGKLGWVPPDVPLASRNRKVLLEELWAWSLLPKWLAVVGWGERAALRCRILAEIPSRGLASGTKTIGTIENRDKVLEAPRPVYQALYEAGEGLKPLNLPELELSRAVQKPRLPLNSSTLAK
jgi:hypothetical protein